MVELEVDVGRAQGVGSFPDQVQEIVIPSFNIIPYPLVGDVETLQVALVIRDRSESDRRIQVVFL